MFPIIHEIVGKPSSLYFFSMAFVNIKQTLAIRKAFFSHLKFFYKYINPSGTSFKRGMLTFTYLKTSKIFNIWAECFWQTNLLENEALSLGLDSFSGSSKFSLSETIGFFDGLGLDVDGKDKSEGGSF